MIRPLIVLLLLVSINIKAATTKDSLKDAKDIMDNTKKIEYNLDQVKKELIEANTILLIPSRISGDLKNLISAMEVVKAGAISAQAVPQIAAEATSVSETMTETIPEVKEVQVEFQEVATTLKPITDGIKIMVSAINQGEGFVNGFENKTIKPFYESVMNAQKCVDHSKPDKKPCMQEKLDKLIGPFDAPLHNMDVVLVNIVKAIDTVKVEANKIINSSESLSELVNLINVVENGLHYLETPFREIHKLMKKQFKVGFPYPDPHNIFKKDTYWVKFSGEEIVHGVNHIENDIKHKIRGSLYNIAKAFGVKKLAKKLWDDLNHPLKPLVDKIKKEVKKGINDQIKKVAGSKSQGSKTKSSGMMVQKFHTIIENQTTMLSKLKLSLKSINNCQELSNLCH